MEHRQAVLDGKRNTLATQVTLYGWQQGLNPLFPDRPPTGSPTYDMCTTPHWLLSACNVDIYG